MPFSGGQAWLNKSRKEQNQGKSASYDVGVLLPFFVPFSGAVGANSAALFYSPAPPIEPASLEEGKNPFTAPRKRLDFDSRASLVVN